MAIVFISPKEKQKLFVLIIAGFFVVIIATIGLVVFSAKSKDIQTSEGFFTPKIRINLDVLKSDRLQNLELLPGIGKQYSYQGQDKDNKPQTGKIIAVSINEAEKLLVALGFQQIVFEEVAVGRENPFTPYYEIEVPAPVKKSVK